MFKNAVYWSEIPVIDFERAKKFYSEIYDYEMAEFSMSSKRMGFLPFDLKNGGVGAAIVHGTGYVPSKDGVKLYLSGGWDLNLILSRVETAGGKIIARKTPVNIHVGFFR